ncbi:MAG: DNA-protecting protein DprA [Ruminococcaceae bacterium]|nr:DNA-protecting protein DprA [Oscillospiraceae bacterium]
MNDVIYWIWLAQKNGYTSAEAHKLLRRFPGGAREIYEASPAELKAVTECSPNFLRKLENHDLTEAENILEFCFMNGIRVISCANEHYPRRLHDLYNKPLVLYARGLIRDLDSRFCVSIVGTRDMSEYGKHMTFRLARQLIGYGAIIISGAAYGIDSSANNTAMFLGTETVAVLGSGVNVPYPSANKPMLDWIATNGMVISEFPPNTPPIGRNFPVRNRIISGLCDALIVVEAGEKSGALITARHAADQHRRVYAVPGNAGAPNSMGTNNLIRDGAKLVARSEDVLEDFIDRFNLKQIDRIVNSDKYLRYEYNGKIPILPENMPMTPEQQKKKAGAMIVPDIVPLDMASMPDIPTPADIGREIRASALKESELPAEYRRPAKKTAPPEEPPLRQAADEYTENQPVEPPVIRTEETRPLPTDKPAAKVNPAERTRIFAMMDETCRMVFDAIPDGRSVTTDEIVQLGGFSTDTVMSSLTILELYGTMESLPGGYYRKLI